MLVQGVLETLAHNDLMLPSAEGKHASGIADEVLGEMAASGGHMALEGISMEVRHRKKETT